MKYKMFLGCLIPARLPFIEKSARKVFDIMGYDYSHLEGASCCPDPTGMPSIDHKTFLTLGARNLCLVEDNSNTKLISLCSGCVETLKIVNHEMSHDEETKIEINNILKTVDREYKESVSIEHVVQLFYENLEAVKKYIVKPLKGFKVAVHYGCHLLRPSKIIQFDDPLNPVSMDEIIKALGAESVEYENKFACCGQPLSKTDEDLSNELIYQKYSGIEKSGANCVVLACPACYTQFEFKQKVINKKYETEINLPIFYLTELIAMALGVVEPDLGLKYHTVKVKKFLEEVDFQVN
ncbi:MAG: CoB--CoM heterodisulfide reductase iron-sulfur subunit B family protein [Promethearchaeota archaeon]